MAELGVVEYFGIGEAIGIIATLFVVLYFSRKQMQELSVDIETKILNDLDDKLHGIAEMTINRPELEEIPDRDTSSQAPKMSFAMYVLYVYAHAFHMRQRKVLKDNEWYGWLRSIRAAFKEGSIGDYWKMVEPENWFDPEFQDFINNEIIGWSKKVATRKPSEKLLEGSEAR
jgi:hypothetical protein